MMGNTAKNVGASPTPKASLGDAAASRLVLGLGDVRGTLGAEDIVLSARAKVL